MAQVYAFTDQNGETRLFAEIHPDPAGAPFNGGTITNPLAINATVGSGNVSKVLQIGDPGNPDTLVEIGLADLGGGDENVNVTLAPSGDGTPIIELVDDNSDGFVVLSTNFPNEISLRTGSTGSFFSVGVGGVFSFVVSSVGLGFFGTTPAAKPTVTGAKLPSDVALTSLLSALVALGLIADNTT